jgi:hypothetical protein
VNNGIEQDHRRVKQRTLPMLGFKCFEAASVTLSGIELAANIRKHQFKIGKLAESPSLLQRFGQPYWQPDRRTRFKTEMPPASNKFAPKPF